VEDIGVHGEGWSATTVCLQRDGGIKYLGVTWDMHMSGETELARMTQDMSEALERIAMSKASIPCKWMTLRRSVYERFLYRLRFMCWPLAYYQKLDVVMARGLRNILKLPPNFPTRLLYSSKDQAGLGYERISALAQSRKISLIARYGQDTGMSGKALEGLICRAYHIQGETVEWLVARTLVVKAGAGVVWATSVGEWLNTMSCGLLVSGGPQLQSEEPLPEEVLDLCRSMGVVTVAELKMTGDGDPGLAGDKRELYDRVQECDAETIPCRVGQLWAEPGPLGRLWEILGYREGQLDCMEWHRTGTAASPGVVSGQGPGAFSRGSGGCTLLDRHTFEAEGCHLIHWGPDRVGADGRNRAWVFNAVARTMHPGSNQVRPMGDGFRDWACEADELYVEGRLSPRVDAAAWMRGQGHRTGRIAWTRRLGTRWEHCATDVRVAGVD
jgi:hypothetical protein